MPGIALALCRLDLPVYEPSLRTVVMGQSPQQRFGRLVLRTFYV
jgi:hypothetical protein